MLKRIFNLKTFNWILTAVAVACGVYSFFAVTEIKLLFIISFIVLLSLSALIFIVTFFEISKEKFRTFIYELFANPDGSGSTKRTAGWIMFISAIIIGIVGVFSDSVNPGIFSTVFISLLTSGLGAFGLSTIDTRQYFKYIKDTKQTFNSVEDSQPTVPEFEAQCTALGGDQSGHAMPSLGI